MTKRSTRGFDTLRVLAMKIAPGQENMEATYEAKGKRCWYNSDGNPDQVFVIGGGMDKLLQVAVAPTSRDARYSCRWDFPSRGMADAFVTLLNTIDGISFWQVGLSRQHVMRNEAPLYGYFQEESFQDHTSRDLMDTELMRVEAWKLFAKLNLERGASVVIVTNRVMQVGKLTIPDGSEPIIVTDVENSDIDKGIDGVATKEVVRQGVLDTPTGPVLHFCVFEVHAEAQLYFGQAASTSVGRGWHFGYRP